MSGYDTPWREVGVVDVWAAVAALGELSWKLITHGRPRYSMIPEQDIPHIFPWRSLVDQVLGLYPSGYVRKLLLLSKVLSGQSIPLHADLDDAGCEQRVHVPLTTNPGCIFSCDSERFHMEVGKAYQINPTLRHGVENFGSSERIHLMFNVGL